MGKHNLSKNDRGGLMIAKYNIGPAEQALKQRSPQVFEKFQAALSQGLYGTAWRMILSTGLKLDVRGAK